MIFIDWDEETKMLKFSMRDAMAVPAFEDLIRAEGEYGYWLMALICDPFSFYNTSLFGDVQIKTPVKEGKKKKSDQPEPEQERSNEREKKLAKRICADYQKKMMKPVWHIKPELVDKKIFKLASAKYIELICEMYPDIQEMMRLERMINSSNEKIDQLSTVISEESTKEMMSTYKFRDEIEKRLELIRAKCMKINLKRDGTAKKQSAQNIVGLLKDKYKDL